MFCPDPEPRDLLLGWGAAPELVDRAEEHLAELAALRGWNYISPLAEQWITDRNYQRVIDAGDLHPSTAGHAYFALRLANDLAALSAPGLVER